VIEAVNYWKCNFIWYRRIKSATNFYKLMIRELNLSLQ